MPDWIMQLAAIVAAGVGVYAGIRSDLAKLHEIADGARRAAGEAHRRIDDLLLTHGGKR